jgi:hypothetical protein
MKMVCCILIWEKERQWRDNESSHHGQEDLTESENEGIISPQARKCKGYSQVGFFLLLCAEGGMMASYDWGGLSDEGQTAA